jgi:hypothetical protein
MSEAEAQHSTARKELGTLERSLECGLEVGDALEVRSNSGSFGPQCWVNEIQVVGEGDSATAGDLEDLVLGVAVECNVCEGRRGLRGGQGLGVELPFAIFVAEDELSSLVGSGKDEHERSEHVCSTGRVLMRLEERIFVWMNATKSENDSSREVLRAKITVDIELIQFSLDVHVLRLALKQLILDGSNQARTSDVELGGEIRGIHFYCLAVRFVVDVLTPAAKSGGIACSSEEVQSLRGRRGEIYESTRPGSIEGCGCDGDCTHLAFSLP